MLRHPFKSPRKPFHDRCNKRSLLFEFKRYLSYLPLHCLPTVSLMALDVVWIELPGGQGGSSFTVDRNQASAVSGYFARLFAFKEKHEHDISGLDIETFRLFHSWLKDRELPPDPEDDVYQTEPWLSSTAHAWVLSRILEAPEFEHFCLRTFIKNCALAPFGPWGYVQDNTPPDSPIRRFSNHWIAWNVGILKRETTEFDGLEAKALASQADGYTGNPRLYKLAHWYSPCAARVNAACDHNPKIKEEREHLRPPTAKPPAFSMTTYAERGISLEVPGSRRGSQSTRPRSSRVSSSRQTRHSRISYESRPVSPASSDSSVSPRRRFWLRFASSVSLSTGSHQSTMLGSLYVSS